MLAAFVGSSAVFPERLFFPTLPMQCSVVMLTQEKIKALQLTAILSLQIAQSWKSRAPEQRAYKQLETQHDAFLMGLVACWGKGLTSKSREYPSRSVLPADAKPPPEPCIVEKVPCVV